MGNKHLLKKAKKKVKQKKDFYTHSIIIGSVAVFLIMLQLVVKPWDDWGVLLPIAVMALSVVIHYIMVFGIAGINEKAEKWEANALEDEYLRLKDLEERKLDLMDDDRLMLRQLEEHYRDEDFV